MLIAVLPGDGIGPEVTRAAVEVCHRATGSEIEWTEAPFGHGACLEQGAPFPDATRALCESADAVLDGPFGPLLDELFREEDAWYADNLAVRLEAPAAQILAELGRLELDGLLERMPGGAYIRRVGWRKNVT